MIQTFLRTADADIFFDEVVVRRNVLVAERPIFPETVVRCGFEIEVAEAERDTAPNIGAAASHANATHPEKRLVFRRGVRLFEIVCEPVRGVLVADIEDGLDGTGLANELRSHIAVLQRKRGLMFGKILVRLWATRFEKRYLQASFREPLACPAAGGAGANNDDIEFFTR